MNSTVSTRNFRYGLPPSVTSTSCARLRPLKRHDSVVDGLEPTPPPVVTKDWTVGFKTILGWVANPRVSFNQNALKFVAAKSALHISSMKTLKRISVGERGNYLCPNL